MASYGAIHCGDATTRRDHARYIIQRELTAAVADDREKWNRAIFLLKKIRRFKSREILQFARSPDVVFYVRA